MFDDKGDDMSLCHDKKRSLGLTDDFFSNQNTNSFLGIQLHHWDDKKREKNIGCRGFSHHKFSV